MKLFNLVFGVAIKLGGIKGWGNGEMTLMTSFLHPEVVSRTPILERTSYRHEVRVVIKKKEYHQL